METKFAFGEFKDYKGLTHKVVVAGVVETLPKKTKLAEYIPDSYDNWNREELKNVVEYITETKVGKYRTEEELRDIIRDKHNLEKKYDVVDSVIFDKVLSIGISYCVPEDEYNEDKGKMQAEGRAIKQLNRKTGRLIPAPKGIITPQFVTLAVESLLKDIELNPGKFITGYNEEEKKWRKSQVTLSQD